MAQLQTLTSATTQRVTHLELLEVVEVSGGKVEAETLVGEGDTVVVGVVPASQDWTIETIRHLPLLLLDTGNALPDLDERAVVGVCALV